VSTWEGIGYVIITCFLGTIYKLKWFVNSLNEIVFLYQFDRINTRYKKDSNFYGYLRAKQRAALFGCMHFSRPTGIGGSYTGIAGTPWSI